MTTLFELIGTEKHPAYQALQIENTSRQYDFIKSMVQAALAIQRPFLSHRLLKAFNFHAIACLHSHAGEYRPCQVTVGKYEPPPFYLVDALMDDFVNSINLQWLHLDEVVLATLVLWKLNFIHPFINGNGRSARAACYFVLCVKAGGWLPGTRLLPELINREHALYEAALKQVDQSALSGALNITPLHKLLVDLLNEQINGP